MPEPSDLVLGESAEELVLSRFIEVAEISHLMVAQASRSITILSHDLEPAIYSTEQFCAALAKLCREHSRHASIKILLTDPERLVGRAHRLIQLAQRLPSFIHLHQPAEQHRSTLNAFLTVDTLGYVFREHWDRPEAKACFDLPSKAREYEQTFSEIWDQSQPLSMFRKLSI